MRQTIEEYPDYEITTDGRVWSKERHRPNRYSGYTMKGHWKKQSPTPLGYLKVHLKINKKGKTVFVHRLVAKSFIPNPDNKPEINHINGIVDDNRQKNLEWCTRQENVQHAIRIGLMNNKGENNGRSILDWELVRKLRAEHPNRKVGEKKWKTFGISRTQYYEIIRGTYWREDK